MQITLLPKSFVGCFLNLAAVPVVLQQMGPKVFVAVPDRLNGKKVNDDQKKVLVYIGDVIDIECSADGKVTVNDYYLCDTVQVLEVTHMEDLLEIMSDFQTKFESKRYSNMTVWLPKK